MSRGRLVVGCAVLFALALIAGALAFGRGVATPRASAAVTRSRVIDVVEHDFGIRVSSTRVAAGPVVFRIANRGPDAHELIVVRDRGRLPLRTDGITVDEEALTRRIAGALEPGPAGDVRELRVVLKPGRYVLFCNMYGHYMGGMHSAVVVE
ncbi:MAG: hypothetical protein ACXVRJ_06605 [Gaiellaceae bacterium]